MVVRNRRVQSLILEILQTQPSLRDSKNYLSAFGPRAAAGASSSGSSGSSSPFQGVSAPSSSSSPSSSSAARVRDDAAAAISGPRPPPPPPPAPVAPFASGSSHKGKQPASSSSSSRHTSAWSFLEQQQPRPRATSAKPTPPPAPTGRTEKQAAAQAQGGSQIPEQKQELTGSEAPENPASPLSQRPAGQPPDPQHDGLGPSASSLPTVQAAQAQLRRDQQQQQQQHEVPVPGLEPATGAAAHLPQQHVALVKIQGPFTPRQLASIAEGMVYLKRLGLVSILVVDNEDWHPNQQRAPQQGQHQHSQQQRQTSGVEDAPGDATGAARRLPTGQGRMLREETSRFDWNGELLSSREQMEEAEFSAWASSSRHAHAHAQAPGQAHGLASSQQQQQQQQQQQARRPMPRQESLRKRMIESTHLVAELLSGLGTDARPFPFAMMRVDAQAARKNHQAVRDALAASSSSPTSPDAQGSAAYSSIGEDEIFSRSPLVAEGQLQALRAALKADQIPVLAPFALWNDAETGALKTVSVSADDLLVNLAREMSLEGSKSAAAAAAAAANLAAATSSANVNSAEEAEEEDIDLTPVRLMIINREGGIPSHARGGSPHLSINLASEYKMIQQSFIWGKTHPTAMDNLSTVRACLTYMPQTSSGIVVSHRSPRSLIANLITNKAAHSPSLPHRLLAGRQDVRHTPTIIRSGLSVHVEYDFNKIDWEKMTALLEASFRRKLDRERYVERIRESLDFVIVTGDYEGAAIVTQEYAPNDHRASAEPIAYLDKFAMLPSLQGSGAVDFLWGALRDEVHGLGLLDALNDNGGKAGFGAGRDLVWKSRANNPVNRWYYERSNGFVKIDTRAEQERLASDARLDWALFWCDAEERLAKMAGEIRLGASARPEDVMDLVDEEEEARFRSVMGTDSRSSLGSRFSPSGTRLPSRAVMEAAYAAAGRSAQPSYSKEARSPFGRDLSELSNPVQSETGISSLLPVVAPEEEGRIERWADCMRTIPSAWLS